jgi:N-acyl-D-aspartate/D-glutamate deacylase
VLQIGREANIPVHFSHIKALGEDVWGKSADVIKLIDDAKAAGQNVTANQYPWLASQTGLSAALVPRWVVDGGYPAMIKRFNDPTLMPKIVTEMKDNLRRRNGPHSILFSHPGKPWSGKYLDQVAKEWKVDAIEAAIRILRQTERESIVSFNMSQADVDNFMKQPWVVTSSDGGPGHPREYATFTIKYADYVKKRHVITLPFFIRHTTGLAADMYMLDHRGYLRNGYYADVLVFNPDTYARCAVGAAAAAYADGGNLPVTRFLPHCGREFRVTRRSAGPMIGARKVAKTRDRAPALRGPSPPATRRIAR